MSYDFCNRLKIDKLLNDVSCMGILVYRFLHEIRMIPAITTLFHIPVAFQNGELLIDA
jgi:hypothetical protein